MTNLKKEKTEAKKTIENANEAPRRRGRPRKEETSNKEAKDLSPKAKKEPKAKLEAVKEEKAPAKRGRKPKVASEESSEVKAQKPISAKINTTDAEPDSKPRRGRPAKKKLEKDESQSKPAVSNDYHEEATLTLNPMANARNRQPRTHRQNRKPRNDSRFNSRNNQPIPANNAEFGEEASYEFSQNKQLNRNSRQHSKNPKQRQNKPVNPHASAFDNSSVIAAITGQGASFDYNENIQNYSLPNEEGYREQENRPRQNNRNRKPNLRQPKRPSRQAFQPEYEEASSSLVSQLKSKNSSQRPFEISLDEPQLSLPNGGEYEAQFLLQEYFGEEEFIIPQAKPKREIKKKPAPNLKMFISVQPDEQTEIALTDNKVIVEYFVEMTHQAKIRGNIYKGVVHNIDPNLQAAFINFGGAKNGFLQIDEVHPDYYLTPHIPDRKYKFPLISKVLKPGQEIIVQIVKEPTGSKGAFLTTFISLAGRYLVLSPGQEQIGISRKVSNPEDRAHLREVLEDIEPGKDMGVIMRTAAVGISSELIQDDLDKLQKSWINIVKKASTSPTQTLIHQEVDLPQRVVRDYMSENVKEIWTDDEAMAKSMNKLTKELYPAKRNIAKVHSDPRHSLWERFNLQEQIDEITSREVALPSGGRVCFDQTEALMAIDINSGKTNSKGTFHTMVLQTNIEAAQAIARHLRLRDIGGQIVIDFIELKDRAGIRMVEKAFKEAMQPDRARYEIGNISSFGLLELVRQRIGSSAISISLEPCPHCNGTGVRRNMEWQAQDALKEIARKAASERNLKYVYTTDKELALYLLNTKRDRLIEIENQTNKHIEIIV